MSDTIDPAGCERCGLVACQAEALNAAYRVEYNKAHGPDASPAQREEDMANAPVRAAAHAAACHAVDACLANAQDWRALYFSAEAACRKLAERNGQATRYTTSDGADIDACMGHHGQPRYWTVAINDGIDHDIESRRFPTADAAFDALRAAVAPKGSK